MPRVRRAGTERSLDWYQTLFEVIDMRSFSNLWYWIALAVTWSTTSHWVLGVPFDMLQRARRYGGQADADFEDMVRINVNRLNYIRSQSGVWLVVFASMVITALGILGFWYYVEFAQAVFLLAFPLSIVAGLSFRTAEKIERSDDTGEPLKRRMIRHRFSTQVVGMIALVVTAFWGMWRNLQVGAFGWF
jgi:hypothetical protein